jgi:isopenicillin N synthase-like dioxygenase
MRGKSEWAADTISAMSGSFEAVPVVDLSDYTSCDTSLRSRTVETLGGALVGIGFVVVEGHGIEARLIRDAYALWQRWFALDEAAKRRYAGGEGGARGYTPFGVEHARDSPTPDLKEFWHVGQEPAADRPAAREFPEYPPNVWPREIPELRQPTLALFRELERVAEQLLLALAEYFGLPRETFAAMMREGNSVLRILHYPPVPARPPGLPADAGQGGGGAAAGAPAALRAAPHEDINLVTLLCEATGSGLELLRTDGSWLPVEARPGQIVVDAGDMLSRVTNAVVPAATHRVVNPPAGANRDRYSMPFFVHPYPACDLSVLDRFVSVERPLRFPPATAGELLDRRLREIGLKR